MADKTHFVLTVIVEKVTKKDITSPVHRGGSPNDGRAADRRVTELAKLHVKASDLQEAKEQMTGHIALVQDGEFD